MYFKSSLEYFTIQYKCYVHRCYHLENNDKETCLSTFSMDLNFSDNHLQLVKSTDAKPMKPFALPEK